MVGVLEEQPGYVFVYCRGGVVDELLRLRHGEIIRGAVSTVFSLDRVARRH